MDSPAQQDTMAPALRRMLIPLALAQFICSFAGSNMNVMITDISHDLDTAVQGVQICTTLFLLVMAALMIPCGKLTDRLARGVFCSGCRSMGWGGSERRPTFPPVRPAPATCVNVRGCAPSIPAAAWKKRLHRGPTPGLGGS